MKTKIESNSCYSIRYIWCGRHKKENTHTHTHTQTHTLYNNTQFIKMIKTRSLKRKKKTKEITLSSEHTKDKRKRTNVSKKKKKMFMKFIMFNVMGSMISLLRHHTTKRKENHLRVYNWIGRQLLCHLCIEMCWGCVLSRREWMKSNKINQGGWNRGLGEELLSAVFVVFPYFLFFFFVFVDKLRNFI
jgi:cation transport ATPase